jgi:DNA replication protein DnaC
MPTIADILRQMQAKCGTSDPEELLVPFASERKDLVPKDPAPSRWQCMKCNSSVFVETPTGITGVTPCLCQADRRAAQLLNQCGIPFEHSKHSLDNFLLPAEPLVRKRLSAVRELVVHWTCDFPRASPPGLLFVGAPRSGKTHLAVAALRSVIVARIVAGEFCDYRNLLDQMRRKSEIDCPSSAREAYDRAVQSDVLLLDDLGAYRASEWVHDTLSAIINQRYNSMKPLIATTSYSDPDIPGSGDSKYGIPRLADQIGSHARSRLFGMCSVISMPTWPIEEANPQRWRQTQTCRQR